MKTNRSFLLGFRDGALLAAALVWLAFVLASCSTTRPHGSPYVRTDGTRVGASKQVVFLRKRDETAALHVAMDNAGITVVDSIRTNRRVRAFGTSFITTVTGK